MNMRLKLLHIKNFRACKDISIEFNDYTCLVGPNGTGKSTVLQALNILFRNARDTITDVVNLGKQDFHNGDTELPIEISATFGDLSAEAAHELRHYVRHGEFTMKAIAAWNSDTESAVVEQKGVRNVMPQFEEYFKSEDEGVKAPELKAIYKRCREQFPELPSATSKGDMHQALRDYEEAHEDLCEPSVSNAQLYGFTKGESKLKPFLKWVYIPAVKDASSEQEEGKNTAIGDLLEITVRGQVSFEELDELKRQTKGKYEVLVNKQQQALDGISSSLGDKLRHWAHPGAGIMLKWDTSPGKLISISPPSAIAEVGEGVFKGSVTRMGHGMQRSFLVALLQELAMIGQERQPTVLLGFEEPELYQHPPQARHLAAILEELGGNNAQVIATTHSPLFVSGKGFENMRMFRRNDSGEVLLSHATLADIDLRLAKALGKKPVHSSSRMANIEQILQPSVNEMFFCSLPILLEGVEDVAFISTAMMLYDCLSEFRRLGGHFIVCGGKSALSRPLSIALAIGLPHFVIFDSDSDNLKAKANNERDNGCLLKLCSITGVDPISEVTYWGSNVVMWGSDIRSEIRKELTPEVWDTAQQKVCEEYGYADLKSDQKKKNAMVITATLIQIYEDGKESEQLKKLCEAIISYGNKISKKIGS